MKIFLLFVFLWSSVESEYFDSFSGKEISEATYLELQRFGLVPYCAIELDKCDPQEPRRMDSSCNNLQHPPRGATSTPYRRLLPPEFSAGGSFRSSSSGKPLPRVRPLRVALMSDGRRSSDQYTQMVTNYNVFITGDITSVHDTVNYVAFTRTCCTPEGRLDPYCMPVEVMDDDPHLRRSDVRCLNLTRAVTYQRLGCVSQDVPNERSGRDRHAVGLEGADVMRLTTSRHLFLLEVIKDSCQNTIQCFGDRFFYLKINTATPVLDLSTVYGHTGGNARKGREYQGGRMKSELLNGREWPPNGGQLCLFNQPPRETRCHDAPSAGSNSILGLNLAFMWFFRSHNYIARHLEQINPCWDDDKLYYTARDINIAYFTHIMYYEMMATILGEDFLVENKVIFPGHGHVDDYDPTLEPRVSIEYVNGYRWFHTIQEGRLKLYTKDGRLYEEVNVVDFTLRTGALPLNKTIDGITQGAFRQPSAATDDVVDPDVGERILGMFQFASDVISSDIMKSRDLGLPPYNKYRKLCGLPEAKTFEDLLGWMERPQVEAMASFYESPSDIDIGAAFLAERPMPGAIAGPTLSCILAEQLKYWRRADRFWYENRAHPGSFSEEQLYEIRKMTMGKQLCLHGEGVDAVQPNVFLLPGPGNEITKCSEYDMPNLDAFRDSKCYPNLSRSYDTTKYVPQFDRNQYRPLSGYKGRDSPPPLFTDQAYNPLHLAYN